MCPHFPVFEGLEDVLLFILFGERAAVLIEAAIDLVALGFSEELGGVAGSVSAVVNVFGVIPTYG